jgi:hypothetical protein
MRSGAVTDAIQRFCPMHALRPALAATVREGGSLIELVTARYLAGLGDSRNSLAISGA